MTAKELASYLGVSQSAVSLAFNGKPGISDETRRKILEAADRMNVRRPARKAAASASIDVVCYKKHGMVFGETPFFAALMEGISAAAAAGGYAVRIFYLYGSDPATLDTIQHSDAAGIVLIATEMSDEEALSPFYNIRKPLVVLDAHFRSHRFPSVIISNEQGAYEATRCLLDHGHRQIGHLRSSVVIGNFTEREEGFLDACSEVEGCTTVTVDVGSTQETAYRDMLAWLQTSPQMPTGFFADNDLIAISCIRALKDMHYRVPEDVSIVAFDDIPMSSVVSPALTTVHVYKEELGGTAVDLLRQMIDKPSRPVVNIHVCTDLVERRSVKDLNKPASAK